MKCPRRFKEFDPDGSMQDCIGRDCAWALAMATTEGDMRDGTFEVHESYRCSVAVIARALNDMDEDSAFMTIPYTEAAS